MITGTSESKHSGAAYIDMPKYIGVASVKIMAINPDNNKLRALGWTIPEDADEPKYVTTTTAEDGTVKQHARVRFMVQIQELEDKPIIALDYWIRPEPWMNKDRNKCQIIDNYGRTAWGTQEEIRNNKIPVYASGPAKISIPYVPSHRGQEEIVKFLMKYLCCTPFESYDNKTKTWKKNEKPGELTIDNWKTLCSGDARELASYVALQPDNLLKVILGVTTTADNKVYQTFIDSDYLPNNARITNGIYESADKIINRVKEDGYHDNCTFSAAPVSLFTVTPTDVEPAAQTPTTTVDVDSLFEEAEPSDPDDLPFTL